MYKRCEAIGQGILIAGILLLMVSFAMSFVDCWNEMITNLLVAAAGCVALGGTLDTWAEYMEAAE